MTDACPFCGGKPLLTKTLRDGYANFADEPDAFAYTIRCHACAAEGGWAKSEDGAWRLWRMRPSGVPLAREPRKDDVDDLCPGCVRGDDTYRDEATGKLMHEHWESDRRCAVYPCSRPALAREPEPQ